MSTVHEWSVKLYVTEDFRRKVTALAAFRHKTLGALICELLLGELRLVGSLDLGDVEFAIHVEGEGDHSL